MQNDPNNPDITYNKHGGNTESNEANPTKVCKQKLQAQVLDFIKSQPDGATCDEIAYGLGMLHQTASARCTELKRDKKVETRGVRRKTRTGRKAAVLYPFTGPAPTPTPPPIPSGPLKQGELL